MLGGDFNEDAYGLASSSSGRRCDLISEAAATKLAAVSLDVRAACASGAVGTPTWSPSSNDLAGRFNGVGGKHEVLDYILLHSSSSGPATPAAPNSVETLKVDRKWSGTFCGSSVLGTLGETYSGEASALTDHNTVTATIQLPDVPMNGKATGAAAAFESMLRSWRSDAGAQEAACGQSGALCAFDTNCCEAHFSWSHVEQHCSETFKCEACTPLGGTCGDTLLQIEGSPCCGYDDYSSGNGAHCELTLNGPICVPKFHRGHGCVWDEECHSRDCRLQWWPPGKYCQ